MCVRAHDPGYHSPKINQAKLCMCGYWQQLSIDSVRHCYDRNVHTSFMFIAENRRIRAVPVRYPISLLREYPFLWDSFLEANCKCIVDCVVLCRLLLLYRNARICFIQHIFMVFIATISFLAFNGTNDAHKDTNKYYILRRFVAFMLNRQQLLAKQTKRFALYELQRFPRNRNSSARRMQQSRTEPSQINSILNYYE